MSSAGTCWTPDLIVMSIADSVADRFVMSLGAGTGGDESVGPFGGDFPRDSPAITE